MLAEEIVGISKVSKFSIFFFTQDRKLGNLGKCSFTWNFNSTCNLRYKNEKKLTDAET